MGSEGDFEPNYALMPNGIRVHRVKVVGTVRSNPLVGNEGTYARFPLDDSTGLIWISGFREMVDRIGDLERGQMVQVVATVNEYRGDLELIAECIRNIDPNFWLLHRAEVLRGELESRREYRDAQALSIHEENVQEARETAREIGMETEVPDQEEDDEEDLSGDILDFLERNDQGQGVPLEDIVANFRDSHSSQEIESGLIDLMDEGDVYEPTVGRYAVI